MKVFVAYFGRQKPSRRIDVPVAETTAGPWMPQSLMRYTTRRMVPTSWEICCAMRSISMMRSWLSGDHSPCTLPSAVGSVLSVSNG
ncbi:hypothetical protein ACH46_04440 [Gordonia phthalatica]|uniref:Uncharacterized protein n=1 Tax=Gordonia phthalatica TaxID=1136941 RepID=A0A0N9MMD8_9ACTN|nr:hypothetical protein ACH46_04440 [Gordonia phthalatica]